MIGGLNSPAFRTHDAPLTTPSFQPAESLPDDSSFAVRIAMFDTALGTLGDFDAAGMSTASHFVTDAGGDSSITVSGSITNDTAEEAPYHVVGNRNPTVLAPFPLQPDTYGSWLLQTVFCDNRNAVYKYRRHQQPE